MDESQTSVLWRQPWDNKNPNAGLFTAEVQRKSLSSSHRGATILSLPVDGSAAWLSKFRLLKGARRDQASDNRLCPISIEYPPCAESVAPYTRSHTDSDLARLYSRCKADEWAGECAKDEVPRGWQALDRCRKC